ncbi:CrcB family protein [Wielerella bovis]|uniref:CrcB family protein n=1 Tax=Wielerella bovis TaxID=2917790 RepID=UPI0020190DB1|nr:CrcB family protein [Wielerella bovis]ULJ68861.1 CrcB family protein [Wielerella bovis]
MNQVPVLAIMLGAIAGALLRWQFATWFNGSLNLLPLGTLLANLLGCFLIGAALAFRLPEFWKWLLITGFLGSLTTFSTFAVELVSAIGQEKWRSVAAILGLHLGGGMGAVMLGAYLVKYFAKGYVS